MFLAFHSHPDHTLLQEWKIVLKHLLARPTSVYELRPTLPRYQGLCVASTSWGIGGVWFGAECPLQPIVWFLQWPPDILKAIQTNQLNINTLELFTILVQHLVLETVVLSKTLHHRSTGSLTRLNLNDTILGHIGSTTSSNISQVSRRSLQTSHSQPGSSYWEPSLHLFGLDSTSHQSSAVKSVPNQYYWHSDPSPRLTCWMAHETRRQMTKAHTPSPSTDKLKHMAELIHRPDEN
jgi:hypothetical protein